MTATTVPFETSAEAGGGPDDSSNGLGKERALNSYQIRVEAARAESEVPIPKQVPNGDEQNYPNFIGNFHKGLPHNATNGEVDPKAYRLFLNALRQGTAAAFETVPLGAKTDLTKLVNPLAGLAFDLEGTDSHQLSIPKFASVASQDLADQMVELYWMALCRDVKFTEYESHPLAQAAAMELSKLASFKGPRDKDSGSVTAQTLFRGFTAGDVIGPYVSQLALKPFAYGPYAMTGQISTYMPGIDYLISPGDWLNCQNGQGPFGQNVDDPQPRFIRNGRDYAKYVHADPNAGLLISFYNAAVWLLENKAPFNPGNPYVKYTTQDPFATFGVPHFLGLLGEAKQRACKAVWYAKWFVHRALRPEAFGGLVHMNMTGKANYPLHKDILNSKAVPKVFSKNGTYFLSQAFPEGCPQHPSYAQGHASMAGACATIIKAAVDGSIQFNTLKNGTIVTARGEDDGLSVVPYNGEDADEITVNGEIDKLASNIGQARDFAGIHWRSDYEWGLRLGEAVAISILRDQRNNYVGENFNGFTITTFDGKKITV